ncbi:MAG: GNAT family N-acetyltransferase [Abditibacteriota bacterium]|nr:GNAT family N-acetyltransferase [Abditibacteriota bacterium]
MLSFTELAKGDKEGAEAMSRLASAIIRDYYDPIIGKEQNDYMIAAFQSPESIAEQLERGCRYFFVAEDGEYAGFMAFYLRKDILYLSKFYLAKEKRGRGLGRGMLAFVIKEARKAGRGAIELNVNKHNPTIEIYGHMGFAAVRAEKNDIGGGFFMDDYVLRLEL